MNLISNNAEFHDGHNENSSSSIRLHLAELGGYMSKFTCMTSYHLTATSDRLAVVTIEFAATENLRVDTILVELGAFVADFDASGRWGGGSAGIFTKIASSLVSPA